MDYRVFNPDNLFATNPQANTGSTGTTSSSSSGSSSKSSSGPSDPGIAGDLGGVLFKAATGGGGLFGTGIADKYNQIYDWATGWEPTAAAASAATDAGTVANSGTFDGSNIANAAYGYVGGELAGELFDNKKYSETGGQIGASIGGAVGGPPGAALGAVLGGALGSIIGPGTEDYRFRTYSGELGDTASQLNLDRAALADSDRADITRGRGQVSQSINKFDLFSGTPLTMDDVNNPPDFNTPEYDQVANKWLTDYNPKPIAAYDDFSELNTFDWSQQITNKTIDKDYASFEGAFGKYTVGHVDDIDGKGKFAKGWVDAIEQLDVAIAGILSPQEIALAKEGLSGSVQASREWHNKAGAKLATNNMIADRYAQIFKLAGRDDLYQAVIDGMDRTSAAVKANGGKRADALPVLVAIIEANQGQTGILSGVTRPEDQPITRPADQPTAQPTTATQPAAQPTTPATTNPATTQPSTQPAATASTTTPRKRYRINRPEGIINPAEETQMTDARYLQRQMA